MTFSHRVLHWLRSRLSHTLVAPLVIVCRSSATAFALAASALHASMFDLGLCCIHHSRTPSLASSHFVAFLSSFFSAFWRFLLSRHFSFLTLAITSSLSVNILFCSLAPPGCSKIGICTLLSPNVGAVCNLSRTIGLGTVRGHPYKWLLKSLLRHLWEQYPPPCSARKRCLYSPHFQYLLHTLDTS